MTTADMQISDEAQMFALGRHIAAMVQPGDMIALSGPLGAGKTSLARSILAGLGYEGEVPSPSFAIVQYYDPPDVRLPVMHADFYRLEHADELEQLGLEDQLDDSLLIAEWPEKAGGLSGETLLLLKIAIAGRSTRVITAEASAGWITRWHKIITMMDGHEHG